MLTRAWLLLGVAALACARPPMRASAPAGPTRLAILDPDYGASLEHPAALRPGDRLEALTLPLADGGNFELEDTQVAGPVVLIWIGGAEHEPLTAWIHQLDHALGQLEQRAATLVFVRPLDPDAALRWAIELRLQTPVAADPEGELARLLDAHADDEDRAPLDFAVLIVAEQTLVYRKLGARRPQLDELLAVLEGEAEDLRCCPEDCRGAACQGALKTEGSP